MRFRARCLAMLLVAVVATPGDAQAVTINAGPIVPFTGLGGSKPVREKDSAGSKAVALYATAFLGPAGTLAELPADARVNFHYGSIHLLFSAAALPQPGGAEVKVAGNLKRLNAHVTLEPLDSAHRPIAELAALEVLATLPDSMIMQIAIGDSSSSNVTSAAFGALTRTLLTDAELGRALGKRVGPVVARFTHLFHHPRGYQQISYVSEHREFGWIWYEQGEEIIEGTHRASAALEIGPTVRYLRVRLRMVADWRSHGAWQRDIEVVLNLGAGPSAG